MRILKLNLRGAIGIIKGMGQEELEVNISQFSKGLIVLVGENGRGKTTIIENLHPYRRLVSREGNLADHFCLKDSYRKLDFEVDGVIYRSEIYIDGLTKKVEAYLFENNNALNDGKPTTYDDVISEVLGSEELFFNSVFCAQKSRGISELSASQKRELFYELLNLNKYQYFQSKTKEMLKNIEIEREAKLSHKYIFEKDISNYEKTQSDLSSTLSDLQNIKEQQLSSEKEIEEINSLKNILGKKKYVLLEQRKQNEKRIEKITQFESELSKINEKHLLEENTLTLQKENAILILSEPSPSDELLVKEINTTQLQIEITDGKGAIINLTNELYSINQEKEKLFQELKHITNQLKDEFEIRTKLKRKTELKVLIDKYHQEEKEIISNQLFLEEKRKEESEKITPKYKVLQSIKEDLYDAKQKKIQVESFKKEEVEKHSAWLKVLMEDSELIGLAPCSKDIGSKCRFLDRAYKSQSTMSSVKTAHDNRLIELNSEIEKLSEKLSSYEQELEILSSDIVAKEIILTKEYERKLGVLAAQKDELCVLMASALYEYNSLSKVNLEDTLVKIENSKTNVSFLNLRISGLEELIESKNARINEIEHKDKLQINSLKERLQRLNSIRKENEDKRRLNIEQCTMEHDHRIEILRKEKTIKIDQLTEWCNMEKQSINLSLEKDLKEVEDNIVEAEMIYTNSLRIKSELFRKSTETEAKTIFLKNEIIRYDNMINELSSIETALVKLDKNIIEYSFLVRAFDKTGIPVLKLENSGAEITSLANELLCTFQSDFRIAFETTRLTKDRKKTKEVFDINVIDKDGISELKNKSGGERVWIETSIQLAIGILLRLQGKKLVTNFLDEQDGALDIENAFSYKQMIEKAHDKSGVHNTIIITHRPELISLIEQKIVLDECGIKLIAS